MIMMKDKEDKDKMQMNVEVKELIRVINHDKKLKEFMKIKTQERHEDEELIAWRRRKGQANVSLPFVLRTLQIDYFKRAKLPRNARRSVRSIQSRPTRASLKRSNTLPARTI